MTDDEGITAIENWLGGYDDRVDFLLRIIRDQGAELIQARQAITNMRNHIDTCLANLPANPVSSDPRAAAKLKPVERRPHYPVSRDEWCGGAYN